MPSNCLRSAPGMYSCPVRPAQALAVDGMKAPLPCGMVRWIAPVGALSVRFVVFGAFQRTCPPGEGSLLRLRGTS